MCRFNSLLAPLASYYVGGVLGSDAPHGVFVVFWNPSLKPSMLSKVHFVWFVWWLSSYGLVLASRAVLDVLPRGEDIGREEEWHSPILTSLLAQTIQLAV